MQEPPSIPYLEPIAARRSAGLTWLPRAIATVYILVVVQALADGFQSRRRRVRFGSLHSGTLPDMGLQGGAAARGDDCTAASHRADVYARPRSS